MNEEVRYELRKSNAQNIFFVSNSTLIDANVVLGDCPSQYKIYS